MFALSVRQSLNFYYWLIGISLVYIALLSWGLQAIALAESAHHIIQQQQNTLSVYQVVFSPSQQQTKVIEPIVENRPQEAPIVLPNAEKGTFVEVKKKTAIPKENPKPLNSMPLKSELQKKQPEKIEPIKEVVQQRKLAPTTQENALASLTPHTVSSLAGRSQALSEQGIGQGDSENDYISSLRREIERHKRYPTQAKRMQQEGEVVVRFLLTTEGMISSITIENTSGISSLDNAAIAAVRRVKPIGPKPANLPNPLMIKLSFDLY